MLPTLLKPLQMGKHVARFYALLMQLLTEADLACTEQQQLRNQIKNIRPSKKDMRQLGRAQQHGVMTGSQIPSGMKERDDRDNATKAKKTNSGAAPPVYPANWPSASTKQKTPAIPFTPK